MEKKEDKMDKAVVENIIKLVQILPEWDVSKISSDECKDILHRSLKKILRGDDKYEVGKVI